MLARTILSIIKPSYVKCIMARKPFSSSKPSTKQRSSASAPSGNKTSPTSPAIVQPLNLENDFSQILAQTKNTSQSQSTGRAWKAEQLRLKSNEDLHRLWYVCVKEKNLLLADQVVEEKFNEVKTLKYRIDRVDKTMARILSVVRERENIRKQYRKKLQEQYIKKKRSELKKNVNEQQPQLPQITWQMLRNKYLDLRRGIDNTKYLQRLWQQKQTIFGRSTRMKQRLSSGNIKKFQSFWQYQMSIGQRPLQQQILRTHIKNWRQLNLKQRKIILGFLNARRSRDAKSTFIKELKILGDRIAQDQARSRVMGRTSSIQNSNSNSNVVNKPNTSSDSNSSQNNQEIRQ